jgi:hypothetical protein
MTSSYKTSLPCSDVSASGPRFSRSACSADTAQRRCSRGHAEVSHPAQHPARLPCDLGPTRRLDQCQKWDLWIWNTHYNAWQLCISGVWHDNLPNTSRVTTVFTFGTVAHCGTGDYGTKTYASNYLYAFGGSAWWGGSVFSGPHHLPT